MKLTNKLGKSLKFDWIVSWLATALLPVLFVLVLIETRHHAHDFNWYFNCLISQVGMWWVMYSYNKVWNEREVLVGEVAKLQDDLKIVKAVQEIEW